MYGAVTVCVGLAEAHRTEAAQLYLEAFGRKLHPFLGRDTRAEEFIQSVISPSHALAATDETGALLGIAGFHDERGGFIGGGLRDLAAVYGWIGALWRGMALSLFEREPEPHQLLMDGVVVNAVARGEGIGGLLLDAIEDHARALGRSAVRLDVVDTNPRARALYIRRGFSPIRKQRLGPLGQIFGFSYSETMVKEL